MLEGIARAQRSLNRPKSSIETLERALELVEGVDGKEGEARARLLAGLARGRMLDGRFADSAATARQALDATIEAGMRWAECHARNTLGFSLAMIGEVDEGAEQLREAIRIARERDDLPDLADAYVNYSDMLHILGRSDEARAITLEGRDAVGDRRPIAIMWLDCQLSEFAYDVGDWDESERRLPDPKRWTGVHTRVNLNLRRAHLLVGPRASTSGAARSWPSSPSWPPTRASRSSSGPSPRSPPSCAAARATSTRRAPRSTAGSTRWSSAPTTRRACPPSPPPA